MSAPVAYRDFIPEDKTGMIALSRKFESLPEIVERANRWIRESGAEIVNVETLMIPGSPEKKKNALASYGEFANLPIGGNWYQVVRVWYRG